MMLRTVFLLIVAVAACLAGPSGAGMEVCNTGHHKIDVFRITPVKNGLFSKDTYHIEGWYNIQPGDCSTFWAQPLSFSHNYRNSFYGMMFIDKHGRSFDFVPTLSKARGYGGEGSGADRFSYESRPYTQVCVADDQATDYELDDGELGKATSCKSIASMHPFTFQFNPHSIDEEDERTFHLSVNVDSIYDEQDSQEEPKVTYPPTPENTPTAQQQYAAPRAKPDGYLAWIAEDVKSYISVAQANGFESYKKGVPTTVGNQRVWDSFEKPVLADSCRVVERGSINTFACVLISYNSKAEAMQEYGLLVKDVIASLPKDWTEASTPPFPNEVASALFYSSSHLSGQVWCHLEKSGSYTINYEVNAPRK